jgi:hypothetical protein
MKFTKTDVSLPQIVPFGVLARKDFLNHYSFSNLFDYER